MPATMEKDDVIYGKDEKVKPNAVDWTKIINLTKPIPLENLPAAKKACEEAAKDPGMANAYVKVGMIKDDLYMRVKLKTGAFKKNIREDTLLAKGYRNIKNAQAQEKETVEVKKKEGQVKANAQQKILEKPMGQVNAEGQYGERITLEFEKLLNNEVIAKHEKVMERIKTCGDLLNAVPATRDNAVKAKMTNLGVLPFIKVLEMGLAQIDDMVKKNQVMLTKRKPEVDKYRNAATFRSQVKQYDTRIAQAIKQFRDTAVVTQEYKQARDGVIRDYRKVIDDLKALQPKANALLAPAQAAKTFAEIKQQHDKIDAVRQEAVTAFAPTRENGTVSENAKKVLTKDDMGDYVFDLTTEAKEENLKISEAMRAALAALEPKLKAMTTTPGAAELLKLVQSKQLQMNK